MKKQLQFFIPVALVVVILFGFTSQQKSSAEGDYLVMRAYESIGAASELVLSYGEGKTEKITLKDLTTENHEYNTDQIANTLNRLKAEGYRVISNSSSGAGNKTSLVHIETFILVRD